MKIRTIDTILTVILLSVVIVVLIKRSYEEVDIKNNYITTNGAIHNYVISGTYKSRSLTYIYKVNNVNYERIIVPHTYFDYCDEDIDRCKDKRF